MVTTEDAHIFYDSAAKRDLRLIQHDLNAFNTLSAQSGNLSAPVLNIPRVINLDANHLSSEEMASLLPRLRT